MMSIQLTTLAHEIPKYRNKFSNYFSLLKMTGELTCLETSVAFPAM